MKLREKLTVDPSTKDGCQNGEFFSPYNIPMHVNNSKTILNPIKTDMLTKEFHYARRSPLRNIKSPLKNRLLLVISPPAGNNHLSSQDENTHTISPLNHSAVLNPPKNNNDSAIHDGLFSNSSKRHNFTPDRNHRPRLFQDIFSNKSLHETDSPIFNCQNSPVNMIKCMNQLFSPEKMQSPQQTSPIKGKKFSKRIQEENKSKLQRGFYMRLKAEENSKLQAIQKQDFNLTFIEHPENNRKQVQIPSDTLRWNDKNNIEYNGSLSGRMKNNNSIAQKNMNYGQYKTKELLIQENSNNNNSINNNNNNNSKLDELINRHFSVRLRDEPTIDGLNERLLQGQQTCGFTTGSKHQESENNINNNDGVKADNTNKKEDIFDVLKLCSDYLRKKDKRSHSSHQFPSKFVKVKKQLQIYPTEITTESSNNEFNHPKEQLFSPKTFARQGKLMRQYTSNRQEASEKQQANKNDFCEKQGNEYQNPPQTISHKTLRQDDIHAGSQTLEMLYKDDQSSLPIQKITELIALNQSYLQNTSPIRVQRSVIEPTICKNFYSKTICKQTILPGDINNNKSNHEFQSDTLVLGDEKYLDSLPFTPLQTTQQGFVNRQKIYLSNNQSNQEQKKRFRHHKSSHVTYPIKQQENTQILSRKILNQVEERKENKEKDKNSHETNEQNRQENYENEVDIEILPWDDKNNSNYNEYEIFLGAGEGDITF